MARVDQHEYYNHCPYCQGLHSIGGYDYNGWWESKCTRSQCRQFFHFGAYPVNTPSLITTVQIRCPNPACSNKLGTPGRRYGIGQFTEGFWLEVKCSACNEFYHFGARGRGRPALITEFCVASLQPELRGRVVSVTRSELADLFTSPSRPDFRNS